MAVLLVIPRLQSHGTVSRSALSVIQNHQSLYIISHLTSSVTGATVWLRAVQVSSPLIQPPPSSIPDAAAEQQPSQEWGARTVSAREPRHDALETHRPLGNYYRVRVWGPATLGVALLFHTASHSLSLIFWSLPLVYGRKGWFKSAFLANIYRSYLLQCYSISSVLLKILLKGSMIIYVFGRNKTPYTSNYSFTVIIPLLFFRLTIDDCMKLNILPLLLSECYAQ